VLEECLGSVDYVAMDVKTCLEKYKLLGAKDTAGFKRSVEMLMTGKVPYEFRTTVVPGLVTADDLTGIGEIVKGARTYAFQQFIPEDPLDDKFKALRPYAPETICGFAETMRKYTENTILRV
jgi:pyruvate formate lyase activating enzyme